MSSFDVVSLCQCKGRNCSPEPRRKLARTLCTVLAQSNNRNSFKVRYDLCRRVDITALADAGGKLPANATRVVKPVYASPMRVQVRLLS